MPTLTIRNVPDDLHRRLKARAEAHRRSLNAEVLVILEDALMADGLAVEDGSDGAPVAERREDGSSG